MKIVVELTSGFCNARCVWCFSQYDTGLTVTKGFTSLINFKRFINLNKGFQDPFFHHILFRKKKSDFSIVPFSKGEALLNPEFIDIIDYAVSKRVPLYHIHTNLAMDLTPEHLKALCKHQKVTVNFGGGNKQTHYQNMKTDFDKVLLNLKRLVYFKRITRSKVTIQAKMVINKRNVNEVSLLRRKVKKISKRITVGTTEILFSCSNSSNEDKLKFIEENLGREIPCRDKWRISKGKVIVSPKIKRCYGRVPTVRWDGAVQICCRAKSHEGIVGNAFEESMKKILTSSVYKKAMILGAKRKYVPFCKFCS